MKIKNKLMLVLLVGVSLTYTACKKLSDGSPQEVSTKAVSSQVALNLAQTLYSGFGIFNINGGLNSPGNIGVSRQKLRLNLSRGWILNDLNSDPTCGMSVDTTLNYSTTLDDGSTASVSGPIGFTFLCTNNVPSGFKVSDNLVIAESTTQLSATYKLGENLTLQSLNPLDNNSSLSLGGTVSLSTNIQYKTGSKQTTSESYNYDFTSVIIDNSGNIDSGTATFSTKGVNASGVWNYQGTVVFLGNNNVKITINGTVYNVNLQTGVVS